MNDWIKEDWRCPECGAVNEVCEHLAIAVRVDWWNTVTADDVPDSVLDAFQAQVDEGVMEGSACDLAEEAEAARVGRTKRRQRRDYPSSAWWMAQARKGTSDAK